ncbi:SDR family NAD(P)-dependent oxidoreductase [Paenibacillus sp. D2_2]|uniref:SDR family NAD(P)-dependent oxidoreductase n=1 Tax=Paenibacillus sp. D2_2 TaxID=3073092 RepID=UPI002815DEE1|nr:SDR family NAD(P)-dependent oxidoreductase [Paenibacillus sp. D2_2]WMT43119.1 SDR family NAD(P)-dependent oxidoreductase [Paenibacillus sp. D2_2]
MEKTVLITGASRGIGRSMALQLARSGYQVVVNGTQQKLIDTVIEEIRMAGGKAFGYCASVADPEAVTAMVEAMVERYGGIDVLIHNAGNLMDSKCLLMSDEQWRSVLDVHLNGAFYCIQRVLPYMTQRGGDILLMTSTAGLQGSVGQVNYSAAKAGILGMVWTLAEELKRYFIRVNAVAPAALTDMTRPVMEHLWQKCALRNEPYPEFWQVGNADDVALFVVSLLVQPDQELTGEIFGINGSKVTRWQKPVPVSTMYGTEAFFTSWNNRKEGQ